MCGEAGSLRGADKAPCAAFSLMMNHPLICADPKSRLPPHETDRERRKGGRAICHYQQIRDKMLAHNNSHVPYANLLEYLNGGAISARRLRELQKQTRNIFIISVQFSRHCADVFDTVCSGRHVMPFGKTDFAQVTQSV